MTWIEALILGIVQGLTEFLPVSSSGHLEIGKVILGVNTEKSMIFTVVVHGATVLSTVVVFRKDIGRLFKGLFSFKYNDETKYISKIGISMIPLLFLAFTFYEDIEMLFTGNMLIVGSMLLVTGLLLTFSYLVKKQVRKISYLDAFVIGIAQAFAVIPGISRSGATIATGLLLTNRKDELARFSFLMVLIPIISANIKDLVDGKLSGDTNVSILALVVGFIAAFTSGVIACKWMIGIVQKGKLIYFAIYCFFVGSIALVYYFFFR